MSDTENSKDENVDPKETANSSENNSTKSKKNLIGIFGCSTLAILGIVILYVIRLSFGTENYSNGERIGLVTQFSNRGMFWKSWEGHLNITQTGMNSADGFDFSIDRSDENEKTVALLDSAASFGWKVKLIYHQPMWRNLLSHRGETDHFIDSVIVVDRNFSTHQNSSNLGSGNTVSGRVVDTVYIVITPGDENYEKFFKK